MDELRQRILNANRKPEIIIVTEVKLKNRRAQHSDAEFSIDGYDLYSNNLQSEDGRGIIIYASLDMKVNEVHISNEFRECIAIQIKLRNNESVQVYAVYRSPNSDEDNNTSLNELIECASDRSRSDLVIVGDMNYPDINWETGTPRSSSGSAQAFLETVRDNFLVQKVSQPTRQRGSDRPTLLDLLLVNDEYLVENIQYESPLGLSDHCMLVFEIMGTKEVKNQKIRRYFLHKANYDQVRNSLERDWQDVLYQNGNDVNQLWEAFEQEVTRVQNQIIPNKEVNPSKKKWSFPLDQKTVELVKKKHRTWQRFIETREQAKLQEYRKIRNQVRKATRRGRKEFELNIAKDVKNNPKRFWSYVNSKTKTRSDIPDLIVNGNNNVRTITTEKEKANEFGKYFSEVLTLETDEPSADLVQQRVDSNLSDISITREMVLKKLKNLKTEKSPGPDQIYPKLLKEAAEEVASPLHTIFTKSLQDGKLPDAWKIAQVCPIHKKGSRSSCNNYRPVSLTSIVCKILESLIRDSIMEYMNNHKYFSDKQFGFLPGRSTVLQLINLMDKWSEALDNGNTIEVMYLDIQKAFDTVPHKRLLLKLNALGIKGNIWNWIKDFLSVRRQFVKIGATSSAEFPVTSGVPQGSVLGPVLFVIYINDLPTHIKSQILMFADDTKIYQLHDGETNNIIQEDIQELDKWAEKWKLNFHPDKCKQMIVSTRRRNQEVEERTMTRRAGTELDQVGISRVSSEKDLGVIFDQELSFKDHISTIIKKASQIMGIIRRTFVYLDPEIFKPLYISLVRSRLEYCQSVWSPYRKGEIIRLEAVQRNATRKINGFKQLSYSERLRRLDLPTLYFRRIRGDMIECYKIIRNIYDSDVSPDLPKAEGNLRGHEHKLFKKRTRNLDLRKYCFSNRIVDQWNDLPGDVVSAPSLNAFKNRLDRHWKNHPLKFNPVE